MCAPPPPRDDLRFSNTTAILPKKKTMWFIGVEVEQETSAPPPKKISWIRRCIARERDERKRAEFRRFVSEFKPEQFLFVDESSKDERTIQVQIIVFYKISKRIQCPCLHTCCQLVACELSPQP